MNKAGWILVAVLVAGSIAGIFSPFIGAYAMPFAILLGLVLLVVAQRRKRAAQLRQGEKPARPQSQKIILLICLVLAIGLVFIGGLTRQ